MKSNLQVNVSDPWEFYEDNDNCVVFFAKVVDCQDDGILFCSDIPIILRSKTQKKQWHNFYGVSRYAEKITAKIDTKEGCSCSIIAITHGIISVSEAKEYAQKWRGGYAMLATCFLK